MKQNEPATFDIPTTVSKPSLVLENLRALASTVLFCLGTAAERGVALMLVPVTTGYLTTQEFGLFSLLYISSAAANYLVVSPLSVVLQRYYHSPHFVDLRGKMLTTLAVLLVIKASFIGGLYWALSRTIAHFILSDESQLCVVQLYSLAIFFAPLPVLPQVLMQLRGRAGRAILGSLAGVCAGASVTLYLLVARGYGIEAMVWGQIAQLALSSLLTWPAYLAESTGRFCLKTMSVPLRWGYSLLPGSFSDLIIDSADRYVISLFLGVGAAGIYDLGYRLASVISVVLIQPIKKGFHPLLLKLERDPDTQRDMIRRSATYFCIAGTWMALFLSVFARDVVQLIAGDASYWSAWLVVPIVSLAYVQHGMGQFFNFGIVMTNNALVSTTILLVSAAVNIGLNFLLIPKCGLIGAAFATLSCYVVWNGLKIYYSQKLYGLKFDLFRQTIATAVAISLGVIAILLDESFSFSFAFTLAIKSLTIAVYPIVLIRGGFFSKQEYHQAGEFLSVIRSRLQLKSEPNLNAGASIKSRAA